MLRGLADDFGLDVTFEETTTIQIERPIGHGAAVEFINVAPNPFLATVGLRVEPAPIGTGIGFRLGVELGAMPLAFFTAVEACTALTHLRAIPRTTTSAGTSYLVEGEIPAARVHALELQLPALTGGEGVLVTAFDHYEPVPAGTLPTRPRTDHDPLNRKGRTVTRP